MRIQLGNAQKNTPHLLSDLLELLVYTRYTGDSWVNRSQFSRIISELPASNEELDIPIEGRELSDAELDDENAAVLDDVWTHLNYRKNTFAETYPFIIHGDEVSLNNSLCCFQKIYLFLLCCSRLRSFDRSTRQKMAVLFSRVSAQAMRSYLPENGVVKIFDANSEDRKKYYSTDLRKALIRLGKQLQASFINEMSCQKQHFSGDAGIDLVAIMPIKNDNAAGVHALLGQCAAREKDWPEKILEAHPLRLKSFYSFLHEPSNVVFIPSVYRDANGQWVNEAKVSGCLLVDRQRLLALLQQSNDSLCDMEWFRYEDLIAV